MKAIVIGFPYWKYSRTDVNGLEAHEIYECAINDKDCIIYENIDAFFNAFNDGYTDATENYYVCLYQNNNISVIINY